VFEVLLESKAKKQRSTTQFVTSVVLHGVLIFVAVQATKGAAEQMTKIFEDTTLVFLEPPKAAPEPEKPPPDVVLSANPPPQGFQTVVAVQDIPTEIPPVNLNERFNPSDFTGKGVEGGIAAGVAGGTGPITGETYLEAQVDDPPQLISSGPQRYPPVLRSAGVTGRVMAQFIVDTTGHAESSSFRVISSTNKAFEESARETILKSVFRPGRVRGQAVRVIVQQAVAFNLN
jgi:periplasmic protein TonB